MSEIDQFIRYQNNSTFPKVAIQVGLYKTLRDRLSKLCDTNLDSYNKLIQDDRINDKINNFIDLEKEIIPTESYDEAALSTIQEQEAWSDRNDLQSPRSQLLSPEMTSYAIDNQNSQTLIEEQPVIEEQSIIPPGMNALWAAIRRRRDETNVITTPKAQVQVVLSQENKIEQLIENIDQLDDSDLLNEVTKTFQEELGDSNQEELIADHNYQQTVFEANKRSQITLDDLNNPIKVDINQKQEEVKQELPNIDIDSSSSSNDHYFPKPDVTPQEIKSGFKFLIDNVDKNITHSPHTSQLGLQPGPSRLSPLLINKPSISNLLDDTAALFDIDDDLNQDVINEIKSPIWDNVDVKTHVTPNFADNKIDIKFGELWGRAESIHIFTNDDQKVDFKFDTAIDGNSTHSYIWGDKVQLTNNFQGLVTELKEVVIVDLDHKPHSIYKNMKYFK
uniref:hypothetical protein n=1 Tax=Russula emetica TaxID=152958 RepID=UPI0031F42C86